MESTSLIRMIPFQPSELPAHPALESTDSPSLLRPDLLQFILTLFDQTHSALYPTNFHQNFKSHGHRPSPPSNTDVETLICTYPSTTLSEKVKWRDHTRSGSVPADGDLARVKPREIPTEHWFARRSYHQNISSKVNPVTASWEEFIFGLRDNHSHNEQEFTPTLYDARHILDWNAELNEVAQKWNIAGRSAEGPGSLSYTNMTLAVYEMCHSLPFPLGPRCFAVLVGTASVTPTQFIAVTIPVNLSSFEGAFYSNGRNRTEGEDSTKRKQVVNGVYAAVEKCELITRKKEPNTSAASGKNAEEAVEAEPETEEIIEWIMATASDAKGNLPMTMQKSAMPSQVPKDVGFFLKWISTVSDAVIKGEQKFESSKRSSVENEERRRSRGASSAR